MRYTGEFKDIDNHSYYVTIITNGDTSRSKALSFSGEPLTTSFVGDDENIYKPVKYSSTTIRLLTDDYLFDLYSSKAHDNTVRIVNYQGSTVWVGYTTPNLYSQGYENPTEEIEVECIDGLSTLQYLNYTTIKENKSIVSFVELIDHLLKKCGCYTRYYISNATYNPNYPQYYYFEKLFLNECNFFDEDDEPMRCDEVLEEVCRFLGVTCYADGTDVYFIDYDAIINGVNTYYLYNVGTTTDPTIVTKKQSHTITADDYTNNGATISLDNVYNKAIVKSSLYTFDEAIPDIFNENDIVNYGSNQYYTDNLVIEDTTIGKGKHKCFYRFYTNPNYKSTYYDYSYYTVSPIATPSTIDYNFVSKYIGATIVKGFFKKVEDEDDNYTLNFTDYLLLHSHDSNKTIGDNYEPSTMTVENELGLPVFESVVDYEPCFLGGDNVYLIIKGSYLQMDREGKIFIPEEYSNKGDKFNKNFLWLKAKLEYDGYYWNGTQWTTTETCFKLEFDAGDSTDHHINKDFAIKNTISWDLGLEGEGYAIKLPSFSIAKQRPKLTLYTPHRLDMSYRCDSVWLKNFGIEIQVSNRNLDSDDETDTEYSNVIDDNFVNEMNDIEFKISTWDNKKANYSSVAEEVGSNLFFLDKTMHKGTGQYIRQEEHYIYKLVNQYSTPSTIVESSLKNDYQLYATLKDITLGKTFIIDRIEIDWFWASAKVRIIEKK